MAGFGIDYFAQRVLEGQLRGRANVLTFNVLRQALKSLEEQSVAGMGAGTAAMIGLVGKGLADENKLELANKAIARDVRRAILAGYDTEVGSRKNRNSTYLRRQNRLTGKLRDALDDLALYQAGPREMRFLNTRLLTQEAAHWARLQFGVQGPDVSIGQSPVVRFNLFGRSHDVGFYEGPRPGYVLPHGIFLESPGVEVPYSKARKGPLGDAFFPSNPGRANAAFGAPTLRIGGIEPRYYLEYGLREFGRSFRRQYNRLVQEAIDGADGRKVQAAVQRAVNQANRGQVDFSRFKVSVTD